MAPEKARPGQTIDVKITLKDPQGKPVAGEVTLHLERGFAISGTVKSVAGKPLDERLEEIGAQLAWVRDYL